MLIKSDKRDYYDNLMGLGINRDIVFNRYPKQIPIEDRDFLLYLKRHKKRVFLHDCNVILIGFCGNIYKAIYSVSHIRNSNQSHDNVYHYTPDSFCEYFKLYEDFNRYGNLSYRSNHAAYKEASTDYFNEPVHVRAWDYFDELKTPYFMIYNDTADKYADNWVIKYGFLLKNINFEQMFNPQQAFQEIEKFICNMASPHKPIPELSNSDKILNAGFDLKSSFRKSKNS